MTTPKDKKDANFSNSIRYINTKQINRKNWVLGETWVKGGVKEMLAREDK